MNFERYKGIKHTDHKRTLDKFFYEGHLLDSVKWCVMEKVHGAHFDIAWDGSGEVEFWTRKRKLKQKQNFNNYHRIREKLTQSIKRVYKIIEKDTGVKNFEVIICGEVFGGTYPHKDIEGIMNVKRVQKGVFYTPDIGFYAFDIKINGEFINYYSALMILNQGGFLRADILTSGTFRECMEYSNKFQTTIPNILGLPKIDDNICEGIVLKPVHPSLCIDGTRVILKSVNEIYDERSRAPKIIREQLELTEKAQKVYEILSTYVTQNRLNNVLSKIDKELLTKTRGFGKIMGDFRKDIMENFNDDYDGVMNTLDKQDKFLVAKRIGKLCVHLVKKEFMQIME